MRSKARSSSAGRSPSFRAALQSGPPSTFLNLDHQSCKRATMPAEPPCLQGPGWGPLASIPKGAVMQSPRKPRPHTRVHSPGPPEGLTSPRRPTS